MSLEDSLWRDAEEKGLATCDDYAERRAVWEMCSVECEDRGTEREQRDAVVPLAQMLLWDEGAEAEELQRWQQEDEVKREDGEGSGERQRGGEEKDQLLLAAVADLVDTTDDAMPSHPTTPLSK